jgi:hypothetical protein
VLLVLHCTLRTLTASFLYRSVMVGKAGAKKFVLYMGHLGRREPAVQPTTFEKKEVAHMRRIMTVLSVAALMAAMVVITATPAFAKPWWCWWCADDPAPQQVPQQSDLMDNGGNVISTDGSSIIGNDGGTYY